MAQQRHAPTGRHVTYFSILQFGVFDFGQKLIGCLLKLLPRLVLLGPGRFTGVKDLYESTLSYSTEVCTLVTGVPC